MKRIITFGELLIRMAAPGYTKLFQKDSFDVSFCGGEANVAASLALFGLDSRYVTKLPNNEIGRAAEAFLKSFSVDSSGIVKGEGRMGLYYLEKGASQRPSKVIYDRKNSVFSLSKCSEYNWDRLFEKADWFHFTGITPALSEELADICLIACKKAKEIGITVSCDLNYRQKLWTNKEVAQNTMRRYMPYVDVCIANEEDADKALGLKADNSDVNSGLLDVKAYEKVARAISEKFGCKFVAMTLRESYSASVNGWSALLFSLDSNEVCLSNKYEIQIVDRVGGGDSFAAGLVFGLITGMGNQETIDFATAASCLKQTIEGDFNRSTVSDVLNLIRNGGNGRVCR